MRTSADIAYAVVSLLLVSILTLDGVTSFFVIVNIIDLIQVVFDSPRKVSGHMHAIIGGSNIDVTYDYNKLTQSKCSSCSVQADKSNYWAPNLFWYNVTGDKTYHLIDYYTKVYYLKRPGPKNETIYPWPKGLTMLAGNMMRRSFNASNKADQAVSFVCQDYYHSHQGDPEWAQRNDFFNHNCPDGMRAQLFFPSCWDGKNLDSPDHKSHMAYPIQNYGGGDCPKTHPVHLVSLFFEYVFDVAKFPFYPNVTNWVFSEGDTTGLSFHGDFQNGWDDGPDSPLTQALNNAECDASGGDSASCPPLAASMDADARSACMPENVVPKEANGQMSPITALPGCNPLWSGPGAKPTCTPAVVDPPFMPVDVQLPPTWQEIGCSTVDSNNQAFSLASFESANMTNEMCIDYCGRQGFIYSATQFSTRCRCGMRSLDSAPLSWTQCAFDCAGQPTQNCGDRYNVRLFKRCNRSYVDCMPGYTSLGCMADLVNGRLMSAQMTTNTTAMTPALCGAMCKQSNYTYAGIEYGSQCFCTNTFKGYAQGQLPPNIGAEKCGMVCPGDNHKLCGGAAALNVYRADNVTVCPTDTELDAAAGPCMTNDGAAETPAADGTQQNGKATASIAGIAAGAAVGGLLILVGATGAFWYQRRRREGQAKMQDLLKRVPTWSGKQVDSPSSIGASQFSLLGTASSETTLSPSAQVGSSMSMLSTVRRVAGPRSHLAQQQEATSLYSMNNISTDSVAQI